MDSDIAGRNSGCGRLGRVNGGVTREHPALVILSYLQILVYSRIFDLSVVTVVDDKRELPGGRALGGIYGNVEVDTKVVDAGGGYLAYRLGPDGKEPLCGRSP